MRLSYVDDFFICICSFDEREKPKICGFLWDNVLKRWYTKDHKIAARLSAFADDLAKNKINQLRSSTTQNAWAGSLIVPKTESLYRFQIEAAHFALSRPNSYLALDPGLGKTPIAAVIAGSLNANVLYICPPFLTRNTENEFRKWAPHLSVSRYKDGLSSQFSDVLIVPDSLINRSRVQMDLNKFKQWIENQNRETILVIDEAHRFKNPQAGRTKALFQSGGIATGFHRKIFLSGTPMPNRPIELYPVLKHACPELINNMSMFQFARKYCQAHETKFGWDYSGASNLKDLNQRIVGPFMLRLKKSDVLKQLPPKTEELVIIGDDLPPKLAEVNSKILEHYSPEDLMEQQIRLELGLDSLHLATYRKELGIAKVKEAVNFIRFTLEESNEAMLIFALHTQAIHMLETELSSYWPLVITGDTPMAKRQEYVEAFQSPDSRSRVFIGNIQAAGVGLTLTRATRVVFVEFSWVPAENEQASDRAHRIGQEGHVHVQYLVFKDSVDKAVIETILKKRKVIEKI